ncbi:DinB family protein [Deinococcus sp. Leaf326]|uniref:DinB family protein n=1 Tax=Deinococcus sp. Leaf326 TaxID=1736338 RepID=UPI0006F966C4|nr:DinB family protein [Deinococcus sp. Leaf326]KQR40875.1 damage-inducible protein DinB [Deinococcus sp. Leaf326]
MDAPAFYAYLTRARRELWDMLRALPDEEVSRGVIPTEGARCLKDLAMHVAVVEDGWFRGDLLGQPLVLDGFGWPEPASADEYWHHGDKPLETVLAYWEAVEAATLAGWPELLEVAASDRRIPVDESRPETLAADEVLWHVMQHEVRHTAQMVQMLRLLGHKPPSLDLVFLTAR